MIKNNNSPQTKKRVFVQSYGCQMNVYDSERMIDVLRPLGYAPTESAQDADLVVLNTCHIREKATEKVYSEIGRLKIQKEAKQKDGKDMMIGVAGCVAQAEGAQIMARAPVVELVVGPQAYHNLPELIARAARKSGETLDTSFDAVDKFDALPLVRENPGVSAFLSIQEGCDKFCSFCVVPYTRGAEFSRPFGKVLEEAQSLAQNGAKEITLLGQNVNAYQGGVGSQFGLGGLIREIAKIDSIKRIRYTTSHPGDMCDDLIDAHANIEKLMPFFHLPVQSGSNKILKAMNRKHNRASFIETIEKIRKARPGIAIATDLIVGFPGETDQDFKDTMSLVDEIDFATAFSFKYSKRPGTPASAMLYQISEAVKDERLQRLQAALINGQSRFNAAKIGQTLKVLATSKGRRSGQILGKSEWLQSVFFDGDESHIGQILEVKINGASASALSGTLVNVKEPAYG